MAAKTPSTVQTESLGSLTLKICTFTDIDDGDTYASGIGARVVGHWFGYDEAAAATPTNLASVANSSGTFTFYSGGSNRTGKLYVLCTGA